MPSLNIHLSRLASFIVTVLAIFSLDSSAAQVWPTISLSPPITGLVDPVHITHAGDGSGRLFVTEEHGRIRIIKNGAVLSTPFLDISSRLGRHIHGIAFPPNYASKQHFYVQYVDTACNITLSRFGLTANPNVADANSEQIVLSFGHVAGNCQHSGSAPAFSPADGYLYVSVGNGSATWELGNTSQDPGTLLGKTLRIDVETGNPSTYTIPPSNPFVSTPGYRDEIWQLGWRNPWRISFDRQTADLYIGDVGESSYEEVNFQAVGSAGGENYGWRIMEGSECFQSGTCSTAGLTFPVLEYDHSQGCSVTGGNVYRGVTYPGMQGIYFYGDYCNGRIWGLIQQGGVWQSALLIDTTLSLVTFGENENGELFVADHNGGTIYGIKGEPPVPTDLAITMSDSPDPIAQDDQLTYNIVVTNQGPSQASGVQVTDSLPAGVKFLSVTSSAGFCSGSSTVNCRIPTLGSGASVGITIVVTAKVRGTQSNTATVSGNEPDPDTANNSSTQGTDVLEAVQFSATSYTVAESGGTVTLTLTRTGSGAFSVNYTTGNNTATAGSDYTAVTGTLNFAASEGSKTFTIPITSDGLPEGNESLNVKLTSANGAGLGRNRRTVVIITDDDTSPTLALGFSAVNYTVNETVASVTITVSRTGDTSGTVSVDWSAASNTATVSTDFTAPGGTLIFAAGVTSRTFAVSITNDTAAEGNESGHLVLSNPTGGAVLGQVRRSVLIILDNDVSSAGFRFQYNIFTVSESGARSITVVRTSSSAAQSVTVKTSNNGTAVAGTDYTALTTTLSFAVGETSKTVSIPILSDTFVEGNESLNLTLSNPTNGGTLGPARTSVLTINDNDSYGALGFKYVVLKMAESGPTALVTVTRAGGTYGVIGVTYATSNNTATGGLDYLATSGTLSFAQGETSKTFTVPIINDTAPDGNESMNLTLTNPTNGATLGQGRRSVFVITDND